MSQDAAKIVDSEYVGSMVRRVCGKDVNLDFAKLRQYFEQSGRTLMWIRWYVQEPIRETLDARRRRESYYRLLRSHGIRVIVCRPKPISHARNQYERNVCDFEISEGIRLATLKAATVVVATGDGHLSAAVRNAHEQSGCRVEVFCDRQSLSSTIEADHFQFLEDIVAAGTDLTRPRRRAA